MFQTLAESHDPTQFKVTMEALERFANKVYQVDLRNLFEETITLPTLTRPKRPTDDELELEEYREEVKEFVKERKTLNKALRSLFSVIWGQCSVSVTTRLLAIDELVGWKENDRVDELLKSIRQVMLQHQHKRCAYVNLFRELRQFYSYRQRESQSLHKYLEVFQIQIENIKRMGGTFGDHQVYVKEMMFRDNLEFTEDSINNPDYQNYVDLAQQKFLSIAFLLGGRVDQYGDLLRELENDYLKGKDFFPNNVTEAYNLMSNYVQRKGLGPSTNRVPVRQNALGFLQNKAKVKGDAGRLVPGTDGVVHERIQCFHCGQKGHYSNKCPVTLLQDAEEPASADIAQNNENEPQDDPDENFSPVTDYMGFGFMQISMFQAEDMRAQERFNGINENWVLLDTQSNCDIFRNPRLLENIRPSPNGNLVLKSNGGEMESTQVGNIPGYGKVWYNPKSMANILSFANVRKKCKVTLQTGPNDPAPTIVVHRNSGTPMLFKEHAMGLYVHDTGVSTFMPKHKLNDRYDYLFLTTTVKELESAFTSYEIKRAKEIMALFRKLGYPSKTTLKDVILRNKINGCDLSVDDFNRAMYIYGDSEASLKGKTTRPTPSSLLSSPPIQIPQQVREAFSSVTLFVDIFFVQGIGFFHSISKHYFFRTVEFIPTNTYRNMLSCLQNIINQYNSRDLDVVQVFGDPEFLCLTPSILPTVLHICGKGDHVPTVERSIRTVKERCRSIIHGLPFTHYTKLMVQSLVYFAVNRLNSFPCRQGLHPYLSPTNLITGRPNPSIHELSLEFGEYVQMNDNVSVSRSTIARTTGGIALYPSNQYGAWFFLSLATGKRVIRSKWRSCSVTNDVIRRVTELSNHEMQADALFLLPEGAATNDNAEFPQEEADEVIPRSLGNEPLVESHGSDEHQDQDAESDEEIEQDEQHNEANVEIDDNDGLVTDDESESNDNEELTQIEGSGTANIASEVELGQEEKEKNINENDIPNQLQVRPEEFNENRSVSQVEENEVEENEAEETEAETEAETINQDRNRSERSIEEVERNRSETTEPLQEFNGEIPTKEDQVLTRQQKKEMIKKTVQNKLSRYNLRSSIRKSQESRFNKDNYSYLLIKRREARFKRKIKTFEDYQDGLNDNIEEWDTSENYNLHDLHCNAVGTCMTQMSAKQGIKKFGSLAIDAMAKEYAQLEGLGVFVPVHKRNMTKETIKGALQVIDLIKEKRCGRIKGRTVVDGRGQRGNYTKLETSSSALTLEAFIGTLAIDALEGRDVAVADVTGAFLKADQPDHVVIKMRGPAVKAIIQVNKLKYQKFIVIENKEEVIYLKLLKAMYGTLTAPLLWYKLLSRTLLDLGFKINCYDPCVANRIVNGKQFTICWYVDDLKLSHAEPQEVTKMLEILNNKFNQMTITRGRKHTYLGMNFELKNGKVEMEMKGYLEECIQAYGEVIVSVASTPANKSLMIVNEESMRLEENKKEKFHHIVQKLLHICKRTRLDLQVAVGFLCTRVRQPTNQDWLKLRRVLQYINGTKNLKRIVSIGNFGRIDIFIDASHGIHQNYRGQTGGCIKMGAGILHGRSSKQGLNSKSSTETELIGVSDYMPYPIWLINFYKEQGYEIKKVVLQQDNESTIRMLTNGRKSCGPKSRHIGIRFFWSTDILRSMKAEIKHCPTTRMLADFFTKPLQGTLFRTMRDVVHGLLPYDALTTESPRKEERPELKNKSVTWKDDVHLDHLEERVGDSKETAKMKRAKYLDDGDLSSNMRIGKTYAEAVKST